jgi:hypothetical protein
MRTIKVTAEFELFDDTSRHQWTDQLITNINKGRAWLVYVETEEVIEGNKEVPVNRKRRHHREELIKP